MLPGSTLPRELRKRGYDVTEIGETERILPGAVVERFVAGADGALEPVIGGLHIRPVALTVGHAAIVKVRCYSVR